MRALCVAAALLLPLAGCYRSHELDEAGRPMPGDLCTGTGGHLAGGCCDWHCGDACVLACFRTVCICPSSDQVWDATRGCVTSSMCGVRGG